MEFDDSRRLLGAYYRSFPKCDQLRLLNLYELSNLIAKYLLVHRMGSTTMALNSAPHELPSPSYGLELGLQGLDNVCIEGLEVIVSL